MIQHTPGPWTLQQKISGYYLRGGGTTLGEVSALALGIDNQANARLIAKAPEMYELLKELGLPVNLTLAPTGLAHKARALLREIEEG